MDDFTSLRIAASGLSAQRNRLATASSNLANANTTHTAEGGPYKRKDVYFSEVKANTFEKSLRKSMGEKSSSEKIDRKISGVEVSKIVTDERAGAKVYDPGHPDADKDGYVNMPNVNVVTELSDIMSTSRSYEANVMAMKAAKEMINAVLTIGKG